MTLWKDVLKRIKSLRELNQQSGSILIISAMMLPIMLGCLGFAYDFGNLYMHKSRLQSIADAAALAGGRAYLNSQKKPDGRDESDDMPDLMGSGDEVTYQLGKRVDRQYSNHWDADNAADEYISKNIVNLGTTVTSDIFSHYALKTEGMGSRVFYRIGLYEKVPLHFLSVILNKKEQKVRAGAIVLIDDGKGITSGKSLFQNLFAIKDKVSLNSDVVVDSEETSTRPSDGGAKINSTFDGGIVFTKAFTTGDFSGVVDYFYSQAEKNYQSDPNNNLSIAQMNRNHPNMGGKAVWDNSIQIDSSVSGFLNKLRKVHIELKKSTNATALKEFKTSLLNSYRNQDNTARANRFTIAQPGGNVTHYFHIDEKNGRRFVFCYPRGKGNEGEDSCLGEAYWLGNSTTETNKNAYYSFFTEEFKYNANGNYTTYVVDTEGNQIFCKRQNKPNKPKEFFIFYRKNVTVNDQDPSGSPTIEYKQLNITNDKIDVESEDSTGIKYSYQYSGNEPKIYFTIEKKEFDETLKRQVNEPQIRYSNVYHWEQEREAELKITVDKLEGEEYYPVYLILTGGVGSAKEEYKAPIKIKVTGSNDRPLIFCNLTKNDITEFSIGNKNNDVTFKGIIYSPYAKVVNTAYQENGVSVTTKGRRFNGNIIAKELEIQDAGVTWTQQNFVADDNDLNKVSDAAAQAQEDRKQQAIAFAKNKLGISDEAWDNPNWFSSTYTTEEAQLAFKQAWNAAREELWTTTGLDMPDWPWHIGDKPTDHDQHHYSVSNINVDTTGESLRIINFRTEYTIEPYINPFNNLYLPEDD